MMVFHCRSSVVTLEDAEEVATESSGEMWNRVQYVRVFGTTLGVCAVILSTQTTNMSRWFTLLCLRPLGPAQMHGISCRSWYEYASEERSTATSTY